MEQLFVLQDTSNTNNDSHNVATIAFVIVIAIYQLLHCRFLAEPALRVHLEPVEILGSIIAAVCHDLDHPGKNAGPRQYICCKILNLPRLPSIFS